MDSVILLIVLTGEQNKARALYINTPRAEEYSDSIINILHKSKNVPYSLNKDSHLSYEFFMEFCRQNNLDPVKTSNTLKLKDNT